MKTMKQNADEENENNDSKPDMDDELYISPRKKMAYYLMPETKEHYLEALKKKNPPEEEDRALQELIFTYRFEAIQNDYKYGEGSADELIGILQNSAKRKTLRKKVATFLMIEGCYCEKLNDYEAALKFYQAGFSYEFHEKDARYYQYNNLAFCLNYLRRFEEAEKYLREAVQILPGQYNAWKNLGVSLEHLDQVEEAADCYVKAVGDRRAHV